MWHSIIKYSPFLLFLLLYVWEMRRRKNKAQQLALTWIGKEYPNYIVENIESNVLIWPISVRIKASDESGRTKMIHLKIGSFFGGVFNDKVHMKEIISS